MPGDRLATVSAGFCFELSGERSLPLPTRAYTLCGAHVSYPGTVFRVVRRMRNVTLGEKRADQSGRFRQAELGLRMRANVLEAR